uniref:Uncharacterized protein n=1 Tax=Timema genevievae TaxID=629358 RepID=A0A7R9K1C3_TIMGE|nr:unnamed protein product [Timema genevievae]
MYKLVVLAALLAVATATPGYLGGPAIATLGAAPLLAAPAVVRTAPVISAAPLAYSSPAVIAGHGLVGSAYASPAVIAAPGLVRSAYGGHAVSTYAAGHPIW